MLTFSQKKKKREHSTKLAQVLQMVEKMFSLVYNDNE